MVTILHDRSFSSETKQQSEIYAINMPTYSFVCLLGTLSLLVKFNGNSFFVRGDRHYFPATNISYFIDREGQDISPKGISIDMFLASIYFLFSTASSRSPT